MKGLLDLLFTLKFLEGRRTYLAAAGLLGLALYQLSAEEFEAAAQSVLAALALLGIRGAIKPTDTTPPAALLVAAALLAGCPCALASGPGVLPGEHPERVAGTPAAAAVELAPLPRAVPGVPPGEHPERVFAALEGEQVGYGLKQLKAVEAWAKTRGRGVRVAVLDTGCDLDHDDLKGAVVASRDFTLSRSGVSDVNGHGTWCAGMIGARVNGIGIQGVAPECELLVAKVLGDSGSGSDAGIAAGIDWSAEQGAKVISMSLGSDSPSPAIHAAVKRAVARGIIVVAAAGNSGPGEGTVGYPGGFPECVCVGAIDSGKAVARFSSRGRQLYVSAAGVQTVSTYPGNRYAPMSGTSMATPHVAGVAALYLAAGGKPESFAEALRASAEDLDQPGRDTRTGWGLPDALKLVGPGSPPPPKPPVIRVVRIGFEDLKPEVQELLRRHALDGAFPVLEFPAAYTDAPPKK